jgi:hypothetical protein
LGIWKKFLFFYRRHEMVFFVIIFIIVIVGAFITSRIPSRKIMTDEELFYSPKEATQFSDTLQQTEKADVVESTASDSNDNKPSNIIPDTQAHTDLLVSQSIDSLKSINDNEAPKFTLKQPDTGILIFQSVPATDKIIVDNEVLPHGTPYSKKYSPGIHQIKYINYSLNLAWETEINLNPGETKIINHSFQSVGGFGTLTIILANAMEVGYGYVYINGELWQQGQYNTTPLKIELPVGSTRVTVKRNGFIASPADTLIMVEANMAKKISFILTPNKNDQTF